MQEYFYSYFRAVSAGKFNFGKFSLLWPQILCGVIFAIPFLTMSNKCEHSFAPRTMLLLAPPSTCTFEGLSAIQLSRARQRGHEVLIQHGETLADSWNENGSREAMAVQCGNQIWRSTQSESINKWAHTGTDKKSNEGQQEGAHGEKKMKTDEWAVRNVLTVMLAFKYRCSVWFFKCKERKWEFSVLRN